MRSFTSPLDGKTPAHRCIKVSEIGPALATGPHLWKRPELRLYVTYADFNKAAAMDVNNGLPTDKTNGVSYGAQVEIWF